MLVDQDEILEILVKVAPGWAPIHAMKNISYSDAWWKYAADINVSW